jgi:tRNA threonylcarbamoyl adenosine modification protein (Sua5/YciO/YrdC/YwlC family)
MHGAARAYFVSDVAEASSSDFKQTAMSGGTDVAHRRERSTGEFQRADDAERGRFLSALAEAGVGFVLPKAAALPEIVTAGLGTAAVRVPDHEAARALIAAEGTPIAAPSANPFGYVSPTTAAHVAEQLGDRVDLILDGGPYRVGLESTILSLPAEPPKLLRPGAVMR